MVKRVFLLLALLITGMGLAVLIRAWVPDQRPLKLQYTVRIADLKSDTAAVDLAVTGVSPGTFRLSTWLETELMGLKDLEIRYVAGDSTRLVSPHQEQTQPAESQQLRLALELPHHIDTLRLHYTVGIGARIAPTLDFPQAAYGLASDSCWLFSGRSLFVVPDAAVQQAILSFDTPADVDMVSSLSNTPNVRCFVLKDSPRTKGDLVDGVFGIGTFARSEVPLGGASVVCWLASSLTDGSKVPLSETVTSLVKAFRDMLGTPPRSRYSLVLVPDGEDGTVSIVSPSPSAQGMSLGRPGPLRWQVLAESMLLYWLNEDGASHTAIETWYREATRSYVAMEMLDRLGLLEMKRLLYVREREYRRLRPRTASHDTTQGRESSMMGVITPAIPSAELVGPQGRLRWLRRRSAAALGEAGRGLAFIDWVNTQVRAKGGTGVEGVIAKRQVSGFTEAAQEIASLTGVGAETIRRYMDGTMPVPSLHDTERVALEGQVAFREMLGNGARDSGATDLAAGLPAGANYIRLVVTGFQQGLLENAGCSSDAGRSGGLARLVTMVDQLRETDPELLFVSLGQMFTPAWAARESSESLAATEVMLAVLQKAGLRFAIIAKEDMLFGVEAIRSLTGSVGLPFCAANLARGGSVVFPSRSVARVRGREVCMIGLSDRPLMGYREDMDRACSELEFRDIIQSVHDAIAGVDTGLVVVVGQIGAANALRLIRAVPEIDVLVMDPDVWGGGDLDEVTGKVVQWPEASAGRVEGTVVVVPMASSAVLTDLTVQLGGQGKVQHYTARPLFLAEEVRRDAEDVAQVDSFYRQFDSRFHGHVLASDRAPAVATTGARYVGAEACRPCHQTQYQRWLGQRHAGAFLVLERGRKQYDGQCTLCHTTGQGVLSGFASLTDRHLLGVQCEVCHLQGSLHMHAPRVHRLSKVPPETTCRACHDDRHSAGFAYAERLARVKHR